MFKPVETTLPAKPSFWSRCKAFWLQEVKVELTPYQQKVEDEINEFLHQEITWEKVHDFLFQEIDLMAPITVELTPYQQKIEDEINAFLYQEVTWQKIHDFLFQEITFGKK